MKNSILFIILSFFWACSEPDAKQTNSTNFENGVNQFSSTSLVILGTIQDAGSPQIGCKKECCKGLFENPDYSSQVVSLGLIDATFLAWQEVFFPSPKTEEEGKMKKLVYVFTLISIVAFWTMPALAASPQSFDSVVVGKNDPPHDVKAVQDAINQGGTALLKGTFDFGKKGRVIIKKDITILGEVDKEGNPLTRINGGFWTFFSPLPSKESPPKVPGPKVAIRGIHFDGAIWTPLHFPYTSGAEISSNKITNVLPFEVPRKWPGGKTLMLHAGAYFGTYFVQRKKILPGAATGKLIFTNNRVDLKNQNPTKILGHGALFLWTWGADILVSGNYITNVSRNSIETIDNYLDENGRGTVTIENNKIVTATEGIPFPGPATPSGIVAGWVFDRSGGTDPSRYCKIRILNNRIEARGKTARAIRLSCDKVVVGFNDIVVGGGPKAAGIGLTGSDALIAKNTFKGSGAFAISTNKRGPLTACRNSFVWNDISGFKGGVAHVAFRGNDNFILGSSCKIVDSGQNNRKLVGGK